MQDGTKLFSVLHQFRFKSIFFRYWKRFAVLITIPFFILNLLIYFSYVSANTEKVTNAFTKSASFAYDSMSRLIDNTDKIFTLLNENPYISSYLLANDIEGNYHPEQMLNAMRQQIIATPALHTIYLYKKNVPYILSTGGGAPLEQFEYLDWLDYYQKTNNSNFILHGRVYDYSIQQERDILTFCYGYYKNGNCLGLIVLNYTFYALDKLTLTQNDEQLFLLDDHGQILYSNRPEMTEQQLSNHYKYAQPQSKLNLHTEQNYISASCSFSIKPLSLVFITGLSAYNNRMASINIFFLTIIVSGILLPLLLTFFISLSFYRSITQILSEFGSTGVSGQGVQNEDEVNFIIQQIANLSDQNQNFEKTLASKMSLLKSTQLAAMQLQFNQHFLFNTLNLISMTARNSAKAANATGNNPTSTAISLLSELLRISLNTEQYIVSLYTEVSYAKKYIEIEQLKLKNGFEVIWDFDEALYKCKTVKLILQPIIENALHHGLKALPAEMVKRLTIQAEAHDTAVVLHIIDNGIGMEPKTLERIQKTLQNSMLPGAKHIGIINVHRRIQLVFGDRYGLQIFSDKNGTDVMITLPRTDLDAYPD